MRPRAVKTRLGADRVSGDPPEEVGDAHRSADDGPGAGQVPLRPARGDGRRRGAALRRGVGDLRPRQRGGARRGAPHRPGGAPHAPRSQRAGDGARGHRVRQGARAATHDGLHDVDRSRRDEYGHGGRGRTRQPPPPPAPPGRRLRQPAPGPGPPAGGGLRRSHDLRQRLLPARLAVLGSDHAPRAAPPEPPGGPRRPHGPGRLRPRNAGPAAGRPDGGLRLPRAFLRAPHPPAPPPGRRSGRAGHRGRPAPPGRAAPPRRRRRRALLPGRVGAPRLRRAPRHPGRRDPGREGRPALGPSRVRGRDRRVRLERRQRAGRRRRSGPRRRDPPGGLPHRLPRPLPGTEPDPGGAERRPARRRQARRPAPGGGRTTRSGGALRRPRRLAGARRAGRGRATPHGGVDPPGRRRHRRAARTSRRPRRR